MHSFPIRSSITNEAEKTFKCSTQKVQSSHCETFSSRIKMKFLVIAFVLCIVKLSVQLPYGGSKSNSLPQGNQQPNTVYVVGTESQPENQFNTNSFANAGTHSNGGGYGGSNTGGYGGSNSGSFGGSNTGTYGGGPIVFPNDDHDTRNRPTWNQGQGSTWQQSGSGHSYNPSQNSGHGLINPSQGGSYGSSSGFSGTGGSTFGGGSSSTGHNSFGHDQSSFESGVGLGGSSHRPQGSSSSLGPQGSGHGSGHGSTKGSGILITGGSLGGGHGSGGLGKHLLTKIKEVPHKFITGFVAIAGGDHLNKGHSGGSHGLGIDRNNHNSGGHGQSGFGLNQGEGFGTSGNTNFGVGQNHNNQGSYGSQSGLGGNNGHNHNLGSDKPLFGSIPPNVNTGSNHGTNSYASSHSSSNSHGANSQANSYATAGSGSYGR